MNDLSQYHWSVQNAAERNRLSELTAMLDRLAPAPTPVQDQRMLPLGVTPRDMLLQNNQMQAARSALGTPLLGAAASSHRDLSLAAQNAARLAEDARQFNTAMPLKAQELGLKGQEIAARYNPRNQAAEVLAGLASGGTLSPRDVPIMASDLYSTFSEMGGGVPAQDQGSVSIMPRAASAPAAPQQQAAPTIPVSPDPVTQPATPDTPDRYLLRLMKDPQFATAARAVYGMANQVPKPGQSAQPGQLTGTADMLDALTQAVGYDVTKAFLMQHGPALARMANQMFPGDVESFLDTNTAARGIGGLIRSLLPGRKKPTDLDNLRSVLHGVLSAQNPGFEIPPIRQPAFTPQDEQKIKEWAIDAFRYN